MPSYYPMFVDLQGKRCLVVGGGEIAARKAQGLLDADARVVVVSPVLCATLAALVDEGLVVHRSRAFRSDDVLGCTLVIGATDQDAVNMAVCQAARSHDVWVNIVDTPEACDFIAPAVVRRGALQVAISTSGHSPTLAKRIRMQLEEAYGHEYGKLLEKLGRERKRIRHLIQDPDLRKAYYERLVDTALTRLSRKVATASTRGSQALQGSHPGAEIVDQGDNDQCHQQQRQQLLIMEQADGHVDIPADPAGTHDTDDRRGTNIHFPAVQGVGD